MRMQTMTGPCGWRRGVAYTVAGCALVAGVFGAGAPAAFAQPATPTTTQAAEPGASDAPDAQADKKPMTADEALAIVQSDYDLGAGGGQLSNLIHDVLKMRALGFYPSNSNRAAIEKALNYRPNQAPLIKALQETLAYQRKTQAQMQAAGAPSGGPFTVGINQVPPGMPAPDNGTGAGVFIAPGGTGQQPIAP